MKRCSKCRETKPSEAFAIKGPGRLHSHCKQCVSDWARANAEKISERKKQQRLLTKKQQTEYAKRYHNKNSESRLAYGRAWYAANREKVLERRRRWTQDNLARCCEQVMRRHARKLCATPKWASVEKMAMFYTEAARRTDETGIKHEVDHIFPLQGRNVCGLHCEANLRIVTEHENRSKHNKMPSLALVRQLDA